MCPASRETRALGRTRWAAAAAVLAVATETQAASLDWKGHTWELTSGGMAGVCAGDPANVTVDAQGYLHLRITKNGSTWSAAELFTTDRLGFGTYQWQTDGPIDSYDRNVVLGLFPYGPQANIGADGTNEIDIEYSRWSVSNGDNGDFTDYPASGSTVGEHSFTFSLAGGTLATSRFAWSSEGITSSLFAGMVAVGASSGLVETWTYAPSNPTTNIPQQPLPLGMNLWCFDAPPSDGAPVEIVIRDFVFVPEGENAAGGAGGEGGVSPASGRAGMPSEGGGPASAGTGGSSNASAGRGNASAGRGGNASAGRGGNAGGRGGFGNAAGTTTGLAGGGPLGGGRGGASPGASGTTSVAGRGGTGSSAPSTPNEHHSGCGCSTPGGRPVGATLPLLGALLGIIVRRRRGPTPTRGRITQARL